MYRVSLILWTLAVAVGNVSGMGFVLLSGLIRLRRLTDDTAPMRAPPPSWPSFIVYPPSVLPTSAHSVPYAGLLAGQPFQQALWLTRLFTLVALSAAAFAVLGLMVLIALWVWIGAAGLPGAEASGFSVGMTVAYGVLVTFSVAQLMWEYRQGSGDLRRLKAGDGSVDTALFRISSLLCCCPQRYRGGDGYAAQAQA